jgi:hypothetical protein
MMAGLPEMAGLAWPQQKVKTNKSGNGKELGGVAKCERKEGDFEGQ